MGIRSKFGAVLITALCVVNLGFTAPVRAHTASASQFWQVTSTLGSNGLTFGDPHLAGSTVNQNFQLDIWFTSCPSTGTGNWSQGVGIEARWIDVNGAPVTSWVKPSGFDYSFFQQSDCQALFSNASRTHRSYGLATAPGAAHVEMRFKGETNGTIFGRAKTANVGEGPTAPTNLQVLSTSPGGKTLTFDMVAALALKAGWSRSEAITATAVARAESSFRTKAISYTGCCHGIWQVNSGVHGTTAEAMFDPWGNAQKARAIFLQANSSWQPWEAYTLGMHEQYMAEAEAAVNRQLSNGLQGFYAINEAPSNSTGSVTLGWSTSCANCSYELQRATASSGPWSAVGTTSALTRVDNNAASGTTYYYRVRAANSQGTSEWSSTVGVTTGAADPTQGVPSTYTGPTGEGAKNPDAGTTEDGQEIDCSGWDLFCWIKAALKWAFVPSTSIQESWNELFETFRSTPPFSLVFIVTDYLTEFHDMAADVVEEHVPFGCVDVGEGLVGDPGTEFCLSEQINGWADSPIAQLVRSLLHAALWAIFLRWLWVRGHSFFGKEPPTMAEDPLYYMS
jgi:hypothetical protein